VIYNNRKVDPVIAINAYRRVEIGLQAILTSALSGDAFQAHALTTLLARKESSLCLLNRILCGPQSRSASFGEENLLAPAVNLNTIPPLVQPVNYASRMPQIIFFPQNFDAVPRTHKH
jgi:hypothetical protein